MSSNSNSVEAGGEFSGHKHSTGRSSHNPQSGWVSDRSELKHQPGRNVAEQNTVEILTKGTHLPPDRTFLPNNAGRDVPVSSREDAAGAGLTNDQIPDTLTGSTSKDVHQGLGMPGDHSQQGGTRNQGGDQGSS